MLKRIVFIILVITISFSIFFIIKLYNQNKTLYSENAYYNQTIASLNNNLNSKEKELKLLNKKITFLEYCKNSPIQIFTSELNNKILISACDSCKSFDIQIGK